MSAGAGLCWDFPGKRPGTCPDFLFLHVGAPDTGGRGIELLSLSPWPARHRAGRTLWPSACPRAAHLCSQRPGERVLSATSLQRRALNCWSVRLAAVVTGAHAQSQTCSLGFSPPGRGSRQVPAGPLPGRASISSSRTCSFWSLWWGRVPVRSRPPGLHPLRPRAPSTCLRLPAQPAAERPAYTWHPGTWGGGG